MSRIHTKLKLGKKLSIFMNLSGSYPVTPLIPISTSSKISIVKKITILSSLSSLILLSSGHAQIFNGGGGIMIGGGYLDDPGKAYGFGQLRGTVYEDEQFTHIIFLEIMGHQDDATLVFDAPGGGSFFENGDISFLNITANYELEAKLEGPLSFYIGGGIGIEAISLDDRFDYSIDNDTNFTAQVFAGFRANFDNGVTGQLGVRHLFREDFKLLGDQFETNDSWGYELSVGWKF
ncbi:hypothetical protein N9Z02_00665 [Akkermansiaceae bacterium]|nr:hypothetical protein [Akkermansiaceae bacterium]